MKRKKLISLLCASAMAVSMLAGTCTTAAAEEAAVSCQELGTPLADLRVRQALAYAIDMDAIVDSLFDGKAEKAISFTSPGDWLNADIPVYSYDPEKARSSLKRQTGPQTIRWMSFTTMTTSRP